MHENLPHVLTSEGAQIASEGSHEARIWAALPVKGQGIPLTPAQLKIKVGDEAAKVGQGRAFKNGWIGKDGSGLVKLVGLDRSFRTITNPLIVEWIQLGFRNSGCYSNGPTRNCIYWDTSSWREISRGSPKAQAHSPKVETYISKHLMNPLTDSLGKFNGSLSVKVPASAPRQQNLKLI